MRWIPIKWIPMSTLCQCSRDGSKKTPIPCSADFPTAPRGLRAQSCPRKTPNPSASRRHQELQSGSERRDPPQKRRVPTRDQDHPWVGFRRGRSRPSCPDLDLPTRAVCAEPAPLNRLKVLAHTGGGGQQADLTNDYNCLLGADSKLICFLVQGP